MISREVTLERLATPAHLARPTTDSRLVHNGTMDVLVPYKAFLWPPSVPRSPTLSNSRPRHPPPP